MTAAPTTDRAERWLAAAVHIAHDLAQDAVWSDGMCAFHGAAAPDAPDEPPRIRSMGGDVYEGSAGIARFLGFAAARTGDERLRETALGALRHAVTTAEGWSLFTGATGIGLVMLELAEALDCRDLVTEAVRMIESASVTAVDEGAPYDLLVGTAGVIVGLGAAVEYDLDGEWQERAFQLGRQLVAAAIPDGPAGRDGPPLSWPLAPGSGTRLCGLAHGAAGIALALDLLGGSTPEYPEWAALARRARAFERAHYSPDYGSWADLRPPEPGFARTEPSYPHMWCHGSIGITAERLLAGERDALARADAAGGLAGVRAHADHLVAGPVGPAAGHEINVSLCHGLSGMIDLFLDAAAVAGTNAWTRIASDLGDLMLNDARRPEGLRSGIIGGWPTPGLMLGSAGAGWILLRLAEPAGLPSGWRFAPLGCGQGPSLGHRV